MSTGRNFFYYYSRALLVAAFAFGLTHAAQSLVVSFVNNRSLAVNPTALLVLILYEIMESIVFLIIGLMLAYIPSRIVSDIFKKKNSRGLLLRVLFGMLMGIVFLPLCASFPFFLFPLPDGPSYLTRCAEFSLPMTIAGALGGYAFWRRTRGTSGNGELDG